MGGAGGRLFVQQSDSLLLEAVGQSVGPGADWNGIFVQRAVAGRDGALGGTGPVERCSPGVGSGR